MSELESKNIESINQASICAKTILRTESFGAIAVIEPDSGHPLNSRVGITNDIDGSPVLLLSQISSHTKAIKNDPRCSLLLGEVGIGDPLNNPRISLIAFADQISNKSSAHKYLRARYLRQHPRAKLYIDFSDFSFFRIQVERVNLNAGFGQFFSLKHDDIILDHDWIPVLSQIEDEIITKSNSYCETYIKDFVENAGVNSNVIWKIISVDPEGFNLRAGYEILRVNFQKTIERTHDMVKELLENIEFRLVQQEIHKKKNKL